MKVLIIEDEIDLAQILKRTLEESGFITEIVHNSSDGLFYATNFNYDASILDISLTETEVFTLLDALRKKNFNLPVIMLTAREDLSDRINELNAGQDDYLAKPFDLMELQTRLNELIRRSKDKSSQEIRISNLVVNLNNKSVFRAGKEIKLSGREYNLLEYLVINRHRVISQSEINDNIYKFVFDSDSNVIDVYIMHLINIIDKDFDKQLIHTVKGAGYKLEEK